MTEKPIVVVGGTGKVGRRVVRCLRGRGGAVRVASRSGEVRFDWEDPGTWGPALEGAGAVYLVYLQDLGSPDAAARLAEVSRLAVSCGVQRLVLQSGRGWAAASAAEEAVQGAGAAWTVLRPSWFAQNFGGEPFLKPLLDGEVRLPAGEGREPFVDADDVAEVAAAVLTEEGHSGQVYELSGPSLLSFGDAIAEIARASGRDIRYVPLTPGQFAAELAGAGVPGDFVTMELGLFGSVRSGANAYLSDGVRRVLGREPRAFSEWAARTAAEGVWAG